MIKMDSIVNAYLQNFKLTEITLLSDSTLSTNTSILGQNYSETGTYFTVDGQIFDKKSGRLFATVKDNYDQLSICHTFSFESGMSNNGQKYSLYNWDFCKSTDKDAVVQDMSLQFGKKLDTLMLYFVDMKYRR